MMLRRLMMAGVGAGPAPGGSDPLFAYVEALIKFGPAGVTDVTGKRVWQLQTGAAVTDTRGVFGGWSLSPGDSAALISPTTPSGISRLATRGELFCAEGWVYFDPDQVGRLGGACVISHSGDNGDGDLWLGIGADNKPTFGRGANVIYPTAQTSVVIVGSSALPRGAWHHLAVSWDGEGFTLYANGVPVGYQASATGWEGKPEFPSRVGISLNVSYPSYRQNARCNVGPVRFTRGHQRYSGAFTPGDFPES